MPSDIATIRTYKELGLNQSSYALKRVIVTSYAHQNLVRFHVLTLRKHCICPSNSSRLPRSLCETYAGSIKILYHSTLTLRKHCICKNKKRYRVLITFLPDLTRNLVSVVSRVGNYHSLKAKTLLRLGTITLLRKPATFRWTSRTLTDR